MQREKGRGEEPFLTSYRRGPEYLITSVAVAVAVAVIVLVTVVVNSKNEGNSDRNIDF